MAVLERGSREGHHSNRHRHQSKSHLNPSHRHRNFQGHTQENAHRRWKRGCLEDSSLRKGKH